MVATVVVFVVVVAVVVVVATEGLLARPLLARGAVLPVQGAQLRDVAVDVLDAVGEALAPLGEVLDAGDREHALGEGHAAKAFDRGGGGAADALGLDAVPPEPRPIPAGVLQLADRLRKVKSVIPLVDLDLSLDAKVLAAIGQPGR